VTSYIYTFVREDISPEQKIVQIGHACYEAGKMFQDNNGISSLILLSAKDESDLLEIGRKIDRRMIRFYTFFEPDFGMGYSALCTEPITEPNQQNFFRNWELYKHTA
jgi:hypothetical protein